MNRRTFLAAAAGLAAGCSRRLGPAGGGPSAYEAEQIDLARRERDRLLAELPRFRVPPTARRTTAPPPANVLDFAPELKGLTKVSVRLHPRFSDEPAADESKLGGRFWWPAADPWPTCEEHGTPLAAVLQLRAEDAPPNWPYRTGTDLLQLLWCPRDHGPGWVKPRLVWRKRSDVSPPPADAPANDLAVLDYVPVPCRLFPERVTEFPNIEALPAPVRDKIRAWRPAKLKERVAEVHRTLGGPEEVYWGDFASEEYERLLSAAPGTKCGGYPRWIQSPDVPGCPSCRWGMDYLLTVDSSEWDGASWERWMPLEERSVRDGTARAEEGYGRAAGLKFGDLGNVHVFVCRRCDGWPVRVVGHCS